VVVSLFAPEGEIVGEFERTQFPDTSLQVGKVFNYAAARKDAGVTETKVEWIPPRELSVAELEEIEKYVDARLPPEPFPDAIR
jgi:hypothetical protein